jgi:hypothetical protein
MEFDAEAVHHRLSNKTATQGLLVSPGSAVEWLVRPDQAHLLSPECVIGQAESCDRSWTGRLSEHLFQSVNGNSTQGLTACSGLWVLSYDNFLLVEVHKLNQKGLSVTTKHLSDLFKKGSARPSELNTTSPHCYFFLLLAPAHWR